MITEFNARLNSELCARTEDIATKVVKMDEQKMRNNPALYDWSMKGTNKKENITRSVDQSLPAMQFRSTPQDVRISDAQMNAPRNDRDVVTHGTAYQTAGNDCHTTQRRPSTSANLEQHHPQHQHDTSVVPNSNPATTGGLKYDNNGRQHVFTTEVSTEQEERSGYVADMERPEGKLRLDDPNIVLGRNEDEQIEEILDAQDAPRYRNTNDNKLKRKKQATKAIDSAFHKSQFGGGVEEDWEQHKVDYQAIALDYHLRSKCLAYFLRLTLRDQALAVHRSEFTKLVKRYPKICDVLRFRFDSATKRETNTKALQRLDFEAFMKDASGSTLPTLNALVLQIDRLSAISIAEKQTDKAKITNLMSSIESTNWYLSATSGVEAIPHFTGVVQKINHELGKIATSIPDFDEPQERRASNRFKIKRDFLLALGVTEKDDSSSSDKSDDNEQARTSDSEENAFTNFTFGGQRRYGKPPGRFQWNNGLFRRDQRRRYGREHKKEQDQKAYEQRCFNCALGVEIKL